MSETSFLLCKGGLVPGAVVRSSVLYVASMVCEHHQANRAEEQSMSSVGTFSQHLLCLVLCCYGEYEVPHITIMLRKLPAGWKGGTQIFLVYSWD